MNFFLLTLIKALVIAFVLMTTLAYQQWLERKVLAHIQVRMGPRRVGPHGLLQPLADVIKLMTKEDMIPSHVNKIFYLLAPFLAVTFALISISVIPFGGNVEFFGVKTSMQLTDIDIGVLFVLAISSIGVYGVALGGWASNNKYSLIGGLRSSAQMISYELPLALAVASPLLLVNTLSFRAMVGSQAGYYFGFLPRWNVFQGPWPQIFAFIIFLIAAFAETNRVPFDLPEAENELVAGFHTEYSSMKFAAFFMAEYANMVTVSAMATLLFLGGWDAPWSPQYGANLIPSIIFLISGLTALYHAANPARKMDKYTFPAFGIVFLILAGVFLLPIVQSWLLPLFWFCAKTGAILFAFIWVRGTLPRFRYDQLMGFAWKFMFPVAMLNLLVTSFLVAWFS